MTSEDEALATIQSTGAVLTGHFVLVSDLHSGSFVSKDLVGVYPRKLRQVATAIAGHFRDVGVEVVAAPAVGAIALGSRVAEELGRDVKFVYVEQDGDRFVLRRGFDQFIKPGKKVLVVEDIITTGKTAWGTIGAVQELGGDVIGIGLLWNRSTEKFEVSVFSFVAQTFPNYKPEECPLCREGVPINTTANKHGRMFLEQHGTDPAGWPANKK